MRIKLCPQGGVRGLQLVPSLQAELSLPTQAGMDVWVWGSVWGSLMSGCGAASLTLETSGLVGVATTWPKCKEVETASPGDIQPRNPSLARVSGT